MRLNISSIVIPFTLLLCLFQTVKPDQILLSDLIKEILIKGFDNDENLSSSEGENSTLASKLGLISREEFVDSEKLKIKTEKLNLSIRLLEHLIKIAKLKTNTTKVLEKMLNHIEEAQFSMMALSRKEMGPFDEITLKSMEIDDLLLIEIREEMLKEREKSSNQLEILKMKLYAWRKDIQLEAEKSAEVASAIDKFSRDELGPQMPDDDENEDSSSKSNFHEDDEELSINEKIASMKNDQYNKRSMYRNKEIVESEIYVNNVLSDETEFPRWIHSYNGIEEIRSKYLTWMELFEHSQASQIQSLKESVLKSGKSIKLFCKTLAEYVSTTNIIQECKSEGDTECEEIMELILDQAHFKQFIEIFSAWKANEGLPLS